VLGDWVMKNQLTNKPFEGDVIEAAQKSRIVVDRWEYIFLLALGWAAAKHYKVEDALLIAVLTIWTALALQPYPRRIRETLPTYVVKTFSVSIYTLLAIMLVPAVLKIFLPAPLAYGMPVFLFCLSKPTFSKPEYFSDSFLKWFLFSLLISVVCAMLAYFLVQ
jgi:hypothetical protein